MLKSNLKSLIGKLNDTCRKALESAAGLCLSQTHYEVDIEHFFIKLFEIPNTDIQKILRYFEINETRLVSDLTRAMEHFKTGNARTPALSPHIPRMIEDAWLVASLAFLVTSIRSGHILLSLLNNDEMSRMLISSSKEFKKISAETLGKTAVVEGFAIRIVEGDVPPPLKNVAIHTLDLGLLQAGAGIKGEFENRLKSVINEVKASAIPIILFIDEAHTLIGAGGPAGSSDAANLLKPALARGELRTIAATTGSEYKRYFEKDPALARRFQLVKLYEPSEDDRILLPRFSSYKYEESHK